MWNDPINLMSYVDLRAPEAVRLPEGEGRPPDARGAHTRAGPWWPTAPARRASSTCSASTSTGCGRPCSTTPDGAPLPPARRAARGTAPTRCACPGPSGSCSPTSSTSCGSCSMVTTDDPSVRRLFPTAYHEDPERDREYQQLVRDELLERRLAALDDRRGHRRRRRARRGAAHRLAHGAQRPPPRARHPPRRVRGPGRRRPRTTPTRRPWPCTATSACCSARSSTRWPRTSRRPPNPRCEARGLAASVSPLPTTGIEPPSSSGLGHRPFTPAARVRIPLGVQQQQVSHHGPVVQFGVHAGLSRRRSRVQIPSGPLNKIEVG